MPVPSIEQSARALPVSLLAATFVVALMGRFTLDRLGFDQLGELDLRLVACPVLAVAVLLWRCRPEGPPQRHEWSPPLLWILALIGYLALTAFWAPHLAEVGERLTDVGTLGLLVVVVIVVSAPDPARARTVVLGMLFGSGLLYAAAGLLIGETDQQGRTTAFGGGPNVYVRVVVLGIIAAIALTICLRRRLFLLPIPVLGAAALLASSRGGVLAALATAAGFVLLFRRRLSWRAGAAALLVAGAGLVAALTVIDPVNRAMLQDRFVGDLLQEGDYSGRPALFGQALSIFADHPVAGGGLDSYYAYFGIGQNLGYPHNLVIEVAATGGLIGVGLLAAVTVSMLRTCVRQSPLSGGQVSMLMAAVFVLAASMSSGDFYDSRYLWIFAVLVANSGAQRSPGGADDRMAPRAFSSLARRCP